MERSLTEQENRVIQAKYAGVPFGKMSPQEATEQAGKLLLKLHVITGWLMPQGEMMLEFYNQFYLKCLESYAHVNPAEMEYAFRSNTAIKDWGKAMNLIMIDEVMVPYLDARYEVSRIEEQVKVPLQIENKAPQMSDEELLHITFTQWKKLQKPYMIPDSLYSYLEKTSQISLSLDEKKAIQARINMEGMTREQVAAECRKLAVHEYFKTLV